MSAIQGEYNLALVLLSFVMAFFGSFTALRVARQITRAQGNADRFFWIGAAAFSLGASAIWSMHFIGMVALDLGIPVTYDIPLTLLSMVLAVAVTAVGFIVVTGREVRLVQFLVGGTTMGVGVAGMHYVGMAAMRVAASMQYDLLLVAISILIAIGASIVALWLAFHLDRAWKTLVGALVMALAVCGMHYTGMAAASFHSSDRIVALDPGGISSELLAYSVFLLSLLTLTVLLSVADRSVKSVVSLFRKRRWVTVASLGLAVVAVGTILIWTAWWTHSSIERSLKERTEQELNIILAANLSAIQEWLEKQRMAVELVSSTSPIQSLAREYLGSSADSDSETALTQLNPHLTPLMEEYGYVGFGLLNLQGQLVVPDPLEGSRKISIEQGPEILLRMLQGNSVASRPFLLEGFREAPFAAILCIAPILGNRQEVLGGFGFLADAESGFTEVLTVARKGSSGETYAFDETGRMISESRFDDQLRAVGLIDAEDRALLRVEIRDPGGNLLTGFRPTVRRDMQPLTLMAADATQKRSGMNLEGYRDYRGVPVVGSWTWLPDYGFGITTEIDVSEAFGRLDDLRGAFWALMALLATTAAATVLSYGAIGNLRRRVRRAQRLGQYTLEKEVGRGGVGVVYKAKHALLKRPTAVKLLTSSDADQETILRFEREVQHTSQLTHPNTIAIYDFGRTPGNDFYYAMEFLHGFTLDHLVQVHGPQPPERIIFILSQVCASLGEAHAAGLTHRDIKPTNIMLCRRGGLFDFVKVFDFGLVKDSGQTVDVRLTRDNVLTGTPLYASPESIRAPDTVDERADIYCLGAVAYYLLTGSDVFSGTSVMDVLRAHALEAPEPPAARLGRPVPEDLENLILLCLEKDKKKRPQKCRVIENALQSCSDSGKWTNDRALLWWEAHAEELLQKDPTGPLRPSADASLDPLHIAMEDRDISASDSL